MIQKLAKIRPYYKIEIAQLYKVSRRVFMEWIEDIEQELEETGYERTQKIFTIKQVEIIFDWIGHPLAIDEMETHSHKYVLILPYTKNELTALYNISGRTFLTHIESIPDKEAKEIIMGENDNDDFYERRFDKRLFKSNEVEMIFDYLGHPYK